MGCSTRKVANLWQKIKISWKIEMPTELHKEKYREFEVKLNYRANICLITMIVTNLMWISTGNQRTTMSRKFLDSGKSECNEEISYALLPYIENLIIGMNIFRLACVIISYWKPRICKYYLLL